MRNERHPFSICLEKPCWNSPAEESYLHMACREKGEKGVGDSESQNSITGCKQR